MQNCNRYIAGKYDTFVSKTKSKTAQKKYDDRLTIKALTSKEKLKAQQNKAKLQMRLSRHLMSPHQDKEITDSITCYIAKNMLPMYTVNKEGFQKNYPHTGQEISTMYPS